MKRYEVVVLAASAGGLGAIESVVGGLPPHFAAAMAIVLHLSPEHPSYLAEILRRHTSLPVQAPESGDPVLEGNIYTARPGQHLLFSAERTFTFSDAPKVNFARPSADRLFITASEVYGRAVIAVVLSGTGRDGSLGAATVHRHGGLVIAQNEQSSEYFSMPSAAIHTGSVDHVLPLVDIPIALRELVEHGIYAGR